MISLLAIAAITGPLVSSVGTDVLCLKDGRVFEPPKLQRAEGGLNCVFTNGTVFVPESMILDSVVSDDPNPPPASPEEQAKLDKGLVRYDGAWVSVKRRDELREKRLAARRKEIEQLRARSEWKNRGITETPHFHYEYTVPDPVFEEMRESMEAYFVEFTKQWKIKPPGRADRLPVCIYVDFENYQQVSGARGGMMAWFRFVRPWELNVFYDRLDWTETLQTMFHEANHYLQKLIDLEFAYPHFPGEALAEYYGASEWDPESKKLTVGLMQDGRIVEVESDIAAGKIMSLDKLVSTDRMYEHYTWGWLLVHYLMNDPRYASKFQKFMIALAKDKDVKRDLMGVDNLRTVTGKEVARIFRRELGLKDADAVRKLESEWHAYAKQKATLISTGGAGGRARGYELAGLMAQRNDRPLRAARLLKEAIEKGSTNPLVHYRYCRLLAAKKGMTNEAITAARKAIELDPMNGRLHAMLGTLLTRDAATKADGEREIALSRELGFELPIERIEIKTDAPEPKDEDDGEDE